MSLLKKIIFSNTALLFGAAFYILGFIDLIVRSSGGAADNGSQAYLYILLLGTVLFWPRIIRDLPDKALKGVWPVRAAKIIGFLLGSIFLIVTVMYFLAHASTYLPSDVFLFVFLGAGVAGYIAWWKLNEVQFVGLISLLLPILILVTYWKDIVLIGTTPLSLLRDIFVFFYNPFSIIGLIIVYCLSRIADSSEKDRT